MNELRYPYKQKIVVLLLSVIIFIAIAIFLADRAMNNTSGATILKVPTSPEITTLIQWALSGLLFSLSLLGIYNLYINQTVSREIVLTNDAITLTNQGFSKKEHRIQYYDITDIIHHQTSIHRSIELKTAKKNMIIVELMLPSKKVFEEFTLELEKRIKENRGV